MPFSSKAQQRYLFSKASPLSKEHAKEWAAKTDFEEIPERAVSEKGKRHLRKIAFDALARVVVGLEKSVEMKTAAMGVARSFSVNTGKFTGLMTSHALKAPGVAASQGAVNPLKGIVSAINKGKPST